MKNLTKLDKEGELNFARKTWFLEQKKRKCWLSIIDCMYYNRTLDVMISKKV